MDKTLQEQLTEINNELDAENQKAAEKNRDTVARLEQQQADLLKAIMEQEQEAAKSVKIETDTQEINSFLDSLEIEGITMRELTAGENEYQMLRIAVEEKLIEQSVKAASEMKLVNLQHQEEKRASVDREGQLKRQNEQLQDRLNQANTQSLQDAEKITQFETQNAQLQLDIKESDSKRDAAVAKAEGLELLLSEKQEQIDLLRAENAVGAVRASQMIDTNAQLKEFAEKIKNSRIHVYDVVPDNEYAPKNFTAKRADNGETVEYNWTQQRNYIELKDEAEVERFRAEHAEQSPVPDSTLDHADKVQPVPEVTAPDVQFPVDAGAVQEEVQVANGESTGESQGKDATISREEFEKLQGRVDYLYKHANIAEVA